METAPKTRIAIVGAGIGGLTLAAAIAVFDKEKNIEVHLYEAASQLEQIGAGLVIWGPTWELLGRIGCRDDLVKNATLLSTIDPESGYGDGFVFKKSDQKEGVTFLNDTVPGGVWGVHRADLQEALLGRLNENTHLHLRNRVVACEEKENVASIKFEDGRMADFDLVIGADGLKSVIRRDLITAKFPGEVDRIQPIWSGTIVYRFITPMQALLQKAPNHQAATKAMMYCGKNKHIVTYPVSMGQFLNAVIFVSEPQQEGKPFSGEPMRMSSREEILSLFEGWEDEVVQMFECADKTSRWVLLTSKPLSAYGSGRIALIGDAAHAMTPHLGSGAGEAMQDAVALASLMIEGIQDGKEIAQVIDTYSKLRQPKGNFVLNTSRSQGFRYEFNTTEFEGLQENEVLQEDRLSNLAKEIGGGWDWLSSFYGNHTTEVR